MNVGFISLGCSKNLVDTEMTIGLFKKNNYNIVNEPQKADIIVINTCGFIESAKEEAINTILEMAEYKKNKCRYLIVMGCLVQRYKEELQKAIPEVDLFIKYSDYDTIWKQIENIIGPDTKKLYENLEFMDREITTGQNYAYLRIAEGCSNFCTFCAIPSIRGKFISRKVEDILEEAKKLASQGYKELIVIAQDTTKYGIDIYGEPKLAELLKELCNINGIKWIRFLYSYPETITDELIEAKDPLPMKRDIKKEEFNSLMEIIIDTLSTKIPDVLKILLKLLYESVNQHFTIEKNNYSPLYTSLIFNFLISPRIQMLYSINPLNCIFVRSLNRILRNTCFNSKFGETDTLYKFNESIESNYIKLQKLIKEKIISIVINDDIKNSLKDLFTEKYLIYPKFLFYWDSQLLCATIDGGVEQIISFEELKSNPV